MTTQNRLFYGDNLDVLRKNIKDETVDLCYIDPPFNSKRNYNQIYNNIGTEDKAQAQAFTDTWTWNSIATEGFDDITNNKNGIFTKQSINLILGLETILGKGSLFAYLVSMTQRIAEIYRVLKPTGSFYLHCDPTASHYLKLVLDAVFCAKGGEFRNEISWCYRGAGYPKKDFGRRHDTIFRYSKSKNFTFNLDEVREEYAQATKDRFSHYIGNKRGKSDFGTQSLHPLGKQPDDWWEIQPIAPSAKERLGYPTQKPEKLLEKIIKASSNEGDTILDAYCGCGTTIAVAERLNRNWIGIDITYQSISLILKRLMDTFGEDFTKDLVDKNTQEIIRPASLILYGVPKDFESAVALANKKDDRLRKEFEKWIILTYSNNRAIINDKKGGDGGIDGTAFIVDYDDKQEQVFKQVIFSVKSNKNLTPSVVRDLYGTVTREKAVMGFLLTLYPMPNLVKEAGKYENYYNKMFGHNYPKISVISVQEVLDGKQMYLPTSVSVLKKAERKTKGGLKDIFD
ncbi:MAG: site-specific DNA-methyltransferase [Bacteroidetes bacterium]|nr:MAG: site-specific DNA-methyltransferase [Bacteroidota bacterium]